MPCPGHAGWGIVTFSGKVPGPSEPFSMERVVTPGR